MSTYCFDVDGTICTITKDHNYQNAKPIQDMIDRINDLHDRGHIIKIFTARGQLSGLEWEDFTQDQLEEWGVQYDEFYQKPAADFYVDDLALTPEEFLTDEKSFTNVDKMRTDIEEYLKNYFFERDSYRNREKIRKWIENYLKENNMGEWGIEINNKSGRFNVVMNTGIELQFNILTGGQING